MAFLLINNCYYAIQDVKKKKKKKKGIFFVVDVVQTSFKMITAFYPGGKDCVFISLLF